MYSTCLFADRNDAAEQLSVQLLRYRGRNPLVLAIPRGAVPMGKIIADRLQGELDIVLAHKISAPYSPEYAIGAIAESGWTYMAPEAKILQISPDYLDQEKTRQLATIQKRREQYTPLRSPTNPTDRIVIIVDDGMATGATMIAALHAIRAKNPAELICALPVAAPDSLEKITELADLIVCLCTPDDFHAVGQFYSNFPQVDDSKVENILASAVNSSSHIDSHA